jgi:hypothetical protein
MAWWMVRWSKGWPASARVASVRVLEAIFVPTFHSRRTSAAIGGPCLASVRWPTVATHRRRLAFASASGILTKARGRTSRGQAEQTPLPGPFPSPCTWPVAHSRWLASHHSRALGRRESRTTELQSRQSDDSRTITPDALSHREGSAPATAIGI